MAVYKCKPCLYGHLQRGALHIAQGRSFGGAVAFDGPHLEAHDSNSADKVATQETTLTCWSRPRSEWAGSKVLSKVGPRGTGSSPIIELSG
jgi:hypothetical protein